MVNIHFAHGDRNYISGYASAGFGKENKETISGNVNYNFFLGNANKITGTYAALNNLLTGTANTINNSSGSNNNNIIGGSGNTLQNSLNVLVAGNGNNVANLSNAIVGGNTNTVSGAQSFTIGDNNTNAGTSTLVVGRYNSISSSSSVCALLGLGLQGGSGGQVVVGSYNTTSTNGNKIFIVGNGGSSNSRKNAFEVGYDGTAKVGAMGSETLSVATKGYVDNVIAKTGNIPEPPDTTGTYVLKASVLTTSSTETVSTPILVGAVPSGSSAYTNTITLKTNLTKGSLYLQVSSNNTNWSNVGYDDGNGSWSGRTDISVNYDTGMITVYVAASSLVRNAYYLRISTYKYTQTTTSKTLSWVKE